MTDDITKLCVIDYMQYDQLLYVNENTADEYTVTPTKKFKKLNYKVGEMSGRKWSAESYGADYVPEDSTGFHELRGVCGVRNNKGCHR